MSDKTRPWPAGPWKIGKAGYVIGISPAKRPPGVKPRDVEDIAQLNTMNEQHDAAACARLIAASPALYEALEALVNWIGEKGMTGSCAIEAIAALAAANGEGGGR